MTTPRLEAAIVAEQWLSDKTPEDAFPINCIQIADSLGIKVRGAKLPNDFQGALFVNAAFTAIIYNENIKEEGRKNFTIAHEIGHFFLHSNRDEVKCSIEDMGEFSISPHGKEIEKEANEFAAHLLMPESDMVPLIEDKPIDIHLVLELAQRYGTTATATACQLVNIVKFPLAVVLINSDNSTHWCFRNRHFRDLFIKKGTVLKIPTHSPHHQVSSEQDIWFPTPIKTKWDIKSSSLEMEEYNQRLYILYGEQPVSH